MKAGISIIIISAEETFDSNSHACQVYPNTCSSPCQSYSAYELHLSVSTQDLDSK